MNFHGDVEGMLGLFVAESDSTRNWMRYAGSGCWRPSRRRGLELTWEAESGRPASFLFVDVEPHQMAQGLPNSGRVFSDRDTVLYVIFKANPSINADGYVRMNFLGVFLANLRGTPFGERWS